MKSFSTAAISVHLILGYSATFALAINDDRIDALRDDLKDPANLKAAYATTGQDSQSGKYGAGLMNLTCDVLNLSQFDGDSDINNWLSNVGDIDGIIHRATMGVDGHDKEYQTRCAYYSKKGFSWGAYHFIRDNGSGKEQAQQFIKAVLNSPNHPQKVLLTIDAEYYTTGTAPTIEKHNPSVETVLECAEEIHRLTGVYPGVYTGQAYLDGEFRTHTYNHKEQQLCSNLWLWVARYSAPNSHTITFPTVSKPPWADWTLWQCSEDAHSSLLGDSLPAEMNVFKGARTDLVNFWNQKSWDYKPQPGAGI